MTLQSNLDGANYYVVEFADGTQLIPNTWMRSKDKQAYWPNFTNNKRYDTAVKNREIPDESWQLFPIIKILATAQTYEKGKERLLEAETFSEVNNSDIDEVELKLRRRKRARLIRDDDEVLGVKNKSSPSRFEDFPSPPTINTQNKALIDNNNSNFAAEHSAVLKTSERKTQAVHKYNKSQILINDNDGDTHYKIPKPSNTRRRPGGERVSEERGEFVSIDDDVGTHCKHDAPLTSKSVNTTSESGIKHVSQKLGRPDMIHNDDGETQYDLPLSSRFLNTTRKSDNQRLSEKRARPNTIDDDETQYDLPLSSRFSDTTPESDSRRVSEKRNRLNIIDDDDESQYDPPLSSRSSNTTPKSHCQRVSEKSSRLNMIDDDDRAQYNPPSFSKVGNVTPQNLQEREKYLSDSLDYKQVDASPSTSEANNSDFRTYQRFVIQSFTALKVKVNSISEAVEEIAAKLNLRQYTTDAVNLESESCMNDIMKRFPLTDLVVLEDLERDLIDDKFRKQLMTMLARIGGGDMKSRATKLMERLLTNFLAEKFSWIGGKKKLIFSNLQLCGVILDVVRIPTPNATNEDISVPIKNWLRHAKERLVRENMRKPVLENEAVTGNKDSDTE